MFDKPPQPLVGEGEQLGTVEEVPCGFGLIERWRVEVVVTPRNPMVGGKVVGETPTMGSLLVRFRGILGKDGCRVVVVEEAVEEEGVAGVDATQGRSRPNAAFNPRPG